LAGRPSLQPAYFTKIPLGNLGKPRAAFSYLSLLYREHNELFGVELFPKKPPSTTITGWSASLASEAGKLFLPGSHGNVPAISAVNLKGGIMANMWKILAGLAAVIMMVAPAQATEFSAAVISKAEGAVMHGKVFVKGDKIRNEIDMDGETNITILRLDKQVAWIAMPEQKMYMEMPLTEAMQKKMMLQDPADRAKMKHLGTETVNGFECDKYEISLTHEGQTVKQYIWIAKKLDMPIKSETSDGAMSMEYRDIKLGGVADGVFEMPSGYEKMEMPFKMPPPKE
jgi:outer membrane lipoprotein-sorting protein